MVTITGKGNYSQKISQKFDIKPKELATADVKVTIPNIKDSGNTLTGANVKPTIKYGKATLKKGKDYLVDFTVSGSTSMQTATTLYDFELGCDKHDIKLLEDLMGEQYPEFDAFMGR